MFKNLLLNNFNVTICNIIRQASSDSVDSKFLKHGFGPILGPQKGLLKANKNISIREYVFFFKNYNFSNYYENILRKWESKKCDPKAILGLQRGSKFDIKIYKNV